MSGQVQELQVPGTPEGGTPARVLPSTLRGAVVTVVKKIVARTGMEPRTMFLAPHNPRNLWQIFNGIEQNEKMKCCGQKYWDFTPSKILEHFGLQSTRENAAKSLKGARVSSSCWWSTFSSTMQTAPG
jgi:hypothetical protein